MNGTTETPADFPPLHRPRLRFTVRGLIVAAVVAAGLYGALAAPGRDVRRAALWALFTSPVWVPAVAERVTPRTLRPVPYLAPAAFLAAIVAPGMLFHRDDLATGALSLAMGLATVEALSIYIARVRWPVSADPPEPK